MIGWLVWREVHYARICIFPVLNREWKKYDDILIFLTLFICDNFFLMIVIDVMFR